MLAHWFLWAQGKQRGGHHGPPRVKSQSGDGAVRISIGVEQRERAGAVSIEGDRGACFAVGAKQSEAGQSVGGHVEADARALLIGQPQRGRAVWPPR